MLHVHGSHRLERQPRRRVLLEGGILAQVKEGHLDGRRPRVAEVPRRVTVTTFGALDTVDRVEASARVGEWHAAREVVDRADRDGQRAAEGVEVGVCDLIDGVFGRAVLAGVDHIHFEDTSLKVDPVGGHRAEEDVEHAHVDLDRVLKSVRSGQDEVRLHNGHDPLRLANEGITSLIDHV